MKSGNGNGWQVQLNEESIMSDPDGDIMNSYIAMGAKWERTAVVKYLRNSWTILVSIDDLACGIENGEHLRSNNE